MRNLDSCCCWRCTLCPCKVRNRFLVNFFNRIILLCIPCIKGQFLYHRLQGFTLLFKISDYNFVWMYMFSVCYGNQCFLSSPGTLGRKVLMDSSVPKIFLRTLYLDGTTAWCTTLECTRPGLYIPPPLFCSLHKIYKDVVQKGEQLELVLWYFYLSVNVFINKVA